MTHEESYRTIDAWHRARQQDQTATRQSDRWAALHAQEQTHHADARIDPPPPYNPFRSVYIKQINSRIDRAVAKQSKEKRPT